MEIYGRAPSKDKELVVAEGWSHYDLYDKPEPVGQALAKSGSVLQETSRPGAEDRRRRRITHRQKKVPHHLKLKRKKENRQNQLHLFQQQDHHDVGHHKLPFDIRLEGSEYRVRGVDDWLCFLTDKQGQWFTFYTECDPLWSALPDHLQRHALGVEDDARHQQRPTSVSRRSACVSFSWANQTH